MANSVDDKNNITTMKALVFHGPNKLAREDRPRPNLRHDARYSVLGRSEIPGTECLKDTLERFLPCWQDHIMPTVRSGKRVLIVAHGNSMRALVKYPDGVWDAEPVRRAMQASANHVSLKNQIEARL